MTPANEIKSFPRLLTRIPGLDELLGGGFLKGGIYLVMGPPGSGKTILANQFGFNYVKAGGRALYVSLLSETHSRLFGHLKSMRFFREEAIADSFNFISAYQNLEKDGLDGLLRTIAQTVRQYKATLLFIDGVASAEELANSPVSFKKFVHDLNTVLSTSGCTALLLSSLHHLSHPEHTMVDGILSLTVRETAMRWTREIQVPKIRGTGQLMGRHVFTISDNGLTVYPRLESVLGRRGFLPGEKDEIISTGHRALDEMLGGLVRGTITSLIGAAGTGKTLIGSKFLAAGGEAGEKGIYFGFYEATNRLVRKSEKANLHLARCAENGLVELLWQPPLENLFDELAYRLLHAIDHTGAKRVFLDGIAGLRDSLGEETRLGPALSALANELRSRGVTTMYSEETNLFPADSGTPVSDHSAVTDNIICLRHVDVNCQLVRLITVLKSRESRPSPQVYQFAIDHENGLHINRAAYEGQALLTPSPRLHKGSRKKSAKRSGRK